jgi:DNA-binding Lrp family transcriptional regulator
MKRKDTSRESAAGGGMEVVATGPSAPLDEIDRAIVTRLREEGRESSRALAQQLGINEVTVAARVRRMEQNFIMRVVAITDIRLFGHRDFAFAFIRVAGRSLLKAAADFAALPDVIAVTVATGRYDLIVPVLGRDHRHLAELFGTILPGVEGVEEVRGLMALDVLKMDASWALLSAERGATPDAEPSEMVDELDLALIQLLQVDARRSNRSIAKDLKVSEGTIRARIKRLLADHVIRIQAVSDALAFGLRAHAYVGITTTGQAESVAAELVARADVAQVCKTLGEFDLIAVMVAADRQALVSAVINDVAMIPGVRRSETFETFASTKHSYQWSWIV